MKEGEEIKRIYREGKNEVDRESSIKDIVKFEIELKNKLIMVMVVMGEISELNDIWIKIEKGEEEDKKKVIIIEVMVIEREIMRLIKEYR